MSTSAFFRIEYSRPGSLAFAPETYDGYDVVSALYDHLPAGAHAAIVIDSYRLDLAELLFVNWVRECLPLAEHLRFGGPDESAYLRRFLPGLPTRARAYYWIAADVPVDSPILVFGVLDDDALIYTRTDANVSGPELILSERDQEGPTTIPRRLVIDEIRLFLTKYLDDLLGAFPFISDDELHRQWRRRIAELA